MRRSVRSTPPQAGDQLLRRVGVHFSCGLDLARRHSLLQHRGGGAGGAQAGREAVDQAGDVLTLLDQLLADAERGAGVALDDGVGERPGGRLRKCRRSSPRCRRRLTWPESPAQSARRSSSLRRRSGSGPMRSTSRRAAAGSSLKPSRWASPTRTARHVARFRRLEVVDLALGGFHRFQQFRRALWRARSGPG